MRVVFALLLTQLVGVSEASDWQAVGPWGGVDLRLSVTDPNGQRIFATSEVGLFRSDDRGESWISLPAPAGRRIFPEQAQLALTPADPERVLAVFDRRYAYLSDNGGQTWRLLLDAQAQNATGREEFGAVAIHPVQTSRMSVFRGIARVEPDVSSLWANVHWYRSEDSGVTFDGQPVQLLGLAGKCHRVALSATSAQYTESEQEQVLISMAATCPPYQEYDLVQLDSSGQLLISTGGMHMSDFFRLPESSLHLTPERYFWLFGRALSEILVAGGELRVLRTQVLDAHLDTDSRLWASSSEGLHFSDDFGTTWTQEDSTGFGLGGAQASETISVRGFAGGRLLASNRESIFALSPGSEAWHVSARGISALPVHTLALANGGESIWVGLGWSTSKTQWYDLLPTARVLYRTSDAMLST